MSNQNQLSQRISRYAAAERVARTCQMQGRRVPEAVIHELQQGAAIYASVPAHVRASIDNELATARLRIEHDLIQQRSESEQRVRQEDAAIRDSVFQRATGHSEDAARKIAAGEKILPNTAYKTDARGNKTKVVETRKPSDSERRRAQLMLAVDKAGWVDDAVKERRDGNAAEFKEKHYQNNQRYHDLARNYDAAEAVTSDIPSPSSESSATSDDDRQATIERTWDSLSDSNTPSESQDSN